MAAARTVDVHCHCAVRDALPIVQETALEKPLLFQLNGALVGPPIPDRLSDMDGQGIDMQVMSINPFWFGAEQDLVGRVVDVQNRKMAEMCAMRPDRLAAFASVAMQFPDLAAQQLDEAMRMGLRGAAIGGSVEGEELSSRRFDPFWAKAEALQAVIFIHPQVNSQDLTGVTKRVRGPGALFNVIGAPLETTFALAHLIFDGTFNRFPRLKICAAHGGGFLPSYAARMDHGCFVFSDRCTGPALEKTPSEYLTQLYYDSIVFTPEGLRHLAAQCGSGQIMIGTDYAVPWVKDPVSLILSTPDLTSAD
jgi:aminocarboxymuconate-semialdehyde decarboxylase